jgi:hypothetical protein
MSGALVACFLFESRIVHNSSADVDLRLQNSWMCYCSRMVTDQRERTCM